MPAPRSPLTDAIERVLVSRGYHKWPHDEDLWNEMLDEVEETVWPIVRHVSEEKTR